MTNSLVVAFCVRRHNIHANKKRNKKFTLYIRIIISLSQQQLNASERYIVDAHAFNIIHKFGNFNGQEIRYCYIAGEGHDADASNLIQYNAKIEGAFEIEDSAELYLRIEDGFCNIATATTEILLKLPRNNPPELPRSSGNPPKISGV